MIHRADQAHQARPGGQPVRPPDELPPASSSNIYRLLGGAAAVRRLAERCYELMDELPEARHVRRLHPAALSRSAECLYECLSGWLGGPALCSARPGPSPLDPIGPTERNEWLLCMRLALAELVKDAELRAALLHALSPMAEALIRQTVFSSNQAESPS